MFRPIIVIEHAAAVHCNAICWYFRAACCKALPPADGAAVPPSVQRVECNLAATSSHALTHSIVNPLMSTHPNLLFVPHSAPHRCARTQTQTNKNTHRQQKTNTKRQHWYFFLEMCVLKQSGGDRSPAVSLKETTDYFLNKTEVPPSHWKWKRRTERDKNWTIINSAFSTEPNLAIPDLLQLIKLSLQSVLSTNKVTIPANYRILNGCSWPMTRLWRRRLSNLDKSSFEDLHTVEMMEEVAWKIL